MAKSVMMDVKVDGVCETPSAFMRFLRASKNVVKSVLNILVLTRPTPDNRLSDISCEQWTVWPGQVTESVYRLLKWNVQGLGNYLNEELETDSKALLVLETLELLKGLWVPMSILNKPIDVYTISPPAVCYTLCLMYTIVRFDVLNITLKRKSIEKEKQWVWDYSIQPLGNICLGQFISL